MSVTSNETWKYTLAQYTAARRRALLAEHGVTIARDAGYREWLKGLPREWEREVQEYPRGAVIPRAVILAFARRVGKSEATRAFRFAGNYETDVLRLTRIERVE